MQGLDLSKYDAVTMYSAHCAECGKDFMAETPNVHLCGECQLVAQVLVLHHTMNYHRWKVIPTTGMYAEAS